MICEVLSASSRYVLERTVPVLHGRGAPGHEIAWILGVHPTTAARHLAGLELPHPGESVAGDRRSPRIALTAEQQCALIAFYCQSTPPAGIQRWTLRMAAKAIDAAPEVLGRTVHHTTIARILNRHHLRPHRSSYFLHIRDPFFFEKMHHILGVYANGSHYVFCFDECPSIQALHRRGPDAPRADAGRSREFVYSRNGTVDLFGFLQVSTGKVRPYCRPTHETETLIEVFTEHVRSQPRDEQLHYICDNLSPHFNEEFCRVVAELSDRPRPPAKAMATGEKRRQWLQSEDKRIVIHFLPFHGSWLNQVEVWFGLLRRYTLDGSWFESVEALVEAILAFADTWNTQLAHPFDFRYTGEGLENVVIRRLTRIFSPNAGELTQVDSKFLADISLLCVRLIRHRRQNIDPTGWQALRDAINFRKPELDLIIDAEPGPLRQQRARNAFAELCAQIADPQTKLPKSRVA